MSVDSDPSRRGGSREPIHLNWFIDVWLYLLSLKSTQNQKKTGSFLPLSSQPPTRPDSQRHPFRDDFGAADD
ncbi:hypothetical protein A3F60_01740 [Candidatus Roizmanbacteria bacterium RIFCSPHIGHO2_12_FULL_39_8]|nr:MAG: hypothetical protein A3F60_01740 [Candidatus Roizmanbacteria bacterium RIFCSPHIGHO2_12_FULL_39_8]